MRVLVVGGSGFVGEHVVRGLAATGSDVIATYAGSSPAFAEGVKALKLDLDRDEHVTLPDVDTVVCLWQPKPGRMERMLSLLPPTVTHILFASTLLVYPDAATPQAEDVTPAPLTPYEREKMNEEERCRRAGKKLTIARLANVYGGAKNRGFVQRVINATRAGEGITINGDGKHVRDYIFVEDAARYLAFLAAHPPENGEATYNVCTGIGTSLLDLVGMIEKATGKKVPLSFGPAVPEKRSIVGDPSKILHFSKIELSYSLAQGLARAVAETHGN